MLITRVCRLLNRHCNSLVLSAEATLLSSYRQSASVLSTLFNTDRSTIMCTPCVHLSNSSNLRLISMLAGGQSQILVSCLPEWPTSLRITDTDIGIHPYWARWGAHSRHLGSSTSDLRFGVARDLNHNLSALFGDHALLRANITRSSYNSEVSSLIFILAEFTSLWDHTREERLFQRSHVGQQETQGWRRTRKQPDRREEDHNLVQP